MSSLLLMHPRLLKLSFLLPIRPTQCHHPRNASLHGRPPLSMGTWAGRVECQVVARPSASGRIWRWGCRLWREISCLLRAVVTANGKGRLLLPPLPRRQDPTFPFCSGAPAYVARLAGLLLFLSHAGWPHPRTLQCQLPMSATVAPKTHSAHLGLLLGLCQVPSYQGLASHPRELGLPSLPPAPALPLRPPPRFSISLAPLNFPQSMFTL